jgi:ABC-type branched-subunit amino acid transport system permease subunit
VAVRQFLAGQNLNHGSASYPRGCICITTFFLALALLIMLVSVRLQDSRIGRAWDGHPRR